MAEHELTVDIERGGYYRSRVICNAEPDAECRNMPECECEGWILERDEQGWFHVPGVDFSNPDEVKPTIHRHTKPSDCNICEWLNADDPIECLARARRSVEIGRIPIKPIWSGDYYEWEPE